MQHHKRLPTPRVVRGHFVWPKSKKFVRRSVGFLGTLPPELIAAILRRLPRHALVRFRQTSRLANLHASKIMVDPLILGLRWRALLRGQKLAREHYLLNGSVETIVFDTSLYVDLTQDEYAAAVRAAIQKEIHETNPGINRKRIGLERALRNWIPENYAVTLSNPKRWQYQGVQQYRKRFEEQEEIRQGNEHLEILAEILVEMPKIKEMRLEALVNQSTRKSICKGDWKGCVAGCLDRSTVGKFDHESIGLVNLVRCWVRIKRSLEGVVWEGRSLVEDLRRWRAGEVVPRHVGSFLSWVNGCEFAGEVLGEV